MIFLVATVSFLGFLLFYAFWASAVIYHLRAYVLPGWTAGGISIIVFILASLALAAMASFYFMQIPWETLNDCRSFICLIKQNF